MGITNKTTFGRNLSSSPTTEATNPLTYDKVTTTSLTNNSIARANRCTPWDIVPVRATRIVVPGVIVVLETNTTRPEG